MVSLVNNSMRTLLFLKLFLLASLTVCSQDFTASTKSGIDLKAYETFRVVPGEIIAMEDRQIDKDVFFKEMREAIVREMTGKGYKHVDDSTAQLTVSYVVETMMQTESQNFGPLGQTPVTNPAMAGQNQSWAREFRRGVMILEIEETRSKSVMWSAEGIMDATRTRGENLLDNAVRAAFRKFPDKTKKEKPKKKKKG